MLAAFIDLDEGLSSPSKLRPDSFMAVTWDPSWSHPQIGGTGKSGRCDRTKPATREIMVTVSHRGN